jgi:hypothetical protein
MFSSLMSHPSNTDLTPMPCKMDHERLDNAIRQFRTYPSKLLSRSSMPFYHHRLYHEDLPNLPRGTAIENAYCLSALYCAKRPSNESTIFRVMALQATQILEPPPQWTTFEHLAHVQSLTLLQIIRLFDGNIRQRAIAEEQNVILHTWTEQLRGRVELDPLAVPDSWQDWIFQESCRRSIIISLLIRACYAQAKHEFCNIRDSIEVLSFTGQAALWNAATSLQWQKAYSERSHFNVVRMGMEEIVAQAKPSDLDEMGLLMLTIYKGLDFVNGWLSGHGAPLLGSGAQASVVEA